jgi:hypothetical protein
MTNGHNVLKADFVRNPLRAHAFGTTLLSSQKRGHLAFFPFLNPRRSEELISDYHKASSTPDVQRQSVS